MERSEIYLNETLRELRAITERIPPDERLPGSPKLTEEIAQVVDRYLIQRKELDAYKRALKDMIAAYDEVTSEYGE